MRRERRAPPGSSRSLPRRPAVSVCSCRKIKTGASRDTRLIEPCTNLSAIASPTNHDSLIGKTLNQPCYVKAIRLSFKVSLLFDTGGHGGPRSDLYGFEQVLTNECRVGVSTTGAGIPTRPARSHSTQTPNANPRFAPARRRRNDRQPSSSPPDRSRSPSWRDRSIPFLVCGSRSQTGTAAPRPTDDARNSKSRRAERSCRSRFS